VGIGREIENNGETNTNRKIDIDVKYLCICVYFTSIYKVEKLDNVLLFRQKKSAE
jgi:hypothetical protein